MEIKTEDKNRFKSAFKKEHGVALDEIEAGFALQNLTDFFALLYQYDLDDRRQLSLAKGEKNV